MSYLWLIEPILGLLLTTRAYVDATRGDAVVRSASNEFLVLLYSRARVSREIWRIPMQALFVFGVAAILQLHQRPLSSPMFVMLISFISVLSLIVDRQSIADWLMARKVHRHLTTEFIALRGPAPKP